MTLDPWVILGVVLAWIASLAAIGVWQNDAGHTDERVSWQAKDNAELKAANATIQLLNDEARAQEHKHAADMAAIGAQHAKERNDSEARHRRDVADARDGALKLRVAGACKADPGGAGAASTAAPGRDDSTTAELPGAVAADLLDLANDADDTVQQLTACQAVVKTFYPTSEGGSP